MAGPNDRRTGTIAHAVAPLLTLMLVASAGTSRAMGPTPFAGSQAAAPLAAPKAGAAAAATESTKGSSSSSSSSSDLTAHLPRGFKPEGITSDGGSGFFVVSLLGSVWHHDTATGMGSKVAGSELSAPVWAYTGLKYCPMQRALFLAGSLHGKVYILFLEQLDGRATTTTTTTTNSSGSGSSTTTTTNSSSSAASYAVVRKVTVQLPPGSYANDVALSSTAVFVTDSWAPRLHALPRHLPDPSSYQQRLTTYSLAGMPPPGPMQLASNGLDVLEEPSAANGNRTLLVVAHSARGALFLVTLPAQGTRGTAQQLDAPVAIGGKPHSELDGVLVLRRGGGGGGGGATRVYVPDNTAPRVLQYSVSPDYRSANVSCIISAPGLDGPGVLAWVQGRLWVTNMRFIDCLVFTPCPHVTFTVTGLDPTDYCAAA